MESFANTNELGVRVSQKENILERSHTETLAGESYEDASKALESVEAVKNFREQVGKLPFGSFFSVFEDITNINRAPISREEKEEEIQTLVLEAGARANRFSPRVADLYLAILSQISGESYEPQFEMTKEKISGLVEEGDLGVLTSGGFSWEMKLNRIETRLQGYLGGARALDKREGREMDDGETKWREEKLKNSPTNPPERRNESRPGVDPMERLKSGERASAIWSISPAVSGVFREQSLSRWDEARKVWTEDEYRYSDVDFVPLCEKEDRRKGIVNITMKAETFPGRWTSLPVPYTHNIHKIEAEGRNVKILKDQNGDFVFMVEGEGGVPLSFSVILAPSSREFLSDNPNAITAPDFRSTVFSEETNGKIAEIGNDKHGNIARGNRLAGHVSRRIRYLAPKDYVESGYYNNFYRTHPGGFAGGVDEARKADCDVGNTYFAALCARLGIPVRHVVGQAVSGDSIHSATGHAWSEVWDETANEWVKIDATPPGDPNLEEKDPSSGEQLVSLGDTQGTLAVRPSDEELEKLRKRLEERKEELSYTREERELAEAGDIEPKEARKIVKEINEAENTRLPNGERVMDVLSGLFNAIVQSRKHSLTDYDGPVSRSDGGERIQSMVRHYIGAMSGESDPVSREREEEEIHEQKLFGGFDLYLIGDKSGSMHSTADGEALWKMQRRAAYLIFSSLYNFGTEMKRAGIHGDNALDVRTEMISFRGDNPKEDIDEDKPLSAQFQAIDKVKMWNSAGNIGGGNGDVAALSHVYDQITQEIEESGGKAGNRLRIVIACSDGGYVGEEEAMRGLAQKLGETGTIVVGMGLTETAATVPVVMHNPPYSFGDIVEDINDLPAKVAEHIVGQSVKLFPGKTTEENERLIQETINSFKKV